MRAETLNWTFLWNVCLLGFQELGGSERITESCFKWNDWSMHVAGRYTCAYYILITRFK